MIKKLILKLRQLKFDIGMYKAFYQAKHGHTVGPFTGEEAQAYLQALIDED